jgi:hypothetical protein
MGRKQKWAKSGEVKESVFISFSREKNNLEIARYFIKSTKNIPKIPKILGNFLEID